MKAIQQFQIQQAQANQKAFWFNNFLNNQSLIHRTVVGSKFYYLTKTDKIKVIKTNPKLLMVCDLNGKDVVMGLVKIKGKLTPVFKSIYHELTYLDLISAPTIEW